VLDHRSGVGGSDAFGERPETLDMLGLMKAGLEPEHLAEAWRVEHGTVPDLEKQLTEVTSIAPYTIDAVSKLLATQEHEQETLLFAARDAENLYDIARVLAPDAVARLLPASVALWVSMGLMDCSEQDEVFLGRYGINEMTVASTNSKIIVIDTGFRGSVGTCLADTVQKVHGADIKPHMSIRLVCMTGFQAGIGTEQIIADSKQTIQHSDLDLPLSGGLIDTDDEGGKDLSRQSFRCAAALQCMPRYHGAFNRVVLQSPSRASTREEMIYDDFESPRKRVNLSIVNPYAAAVVQMAFIKTALEAQ
jgi:hypothetical protein